jgi:signal peptidase II
MGRNYKKTALVIVLILIVLILDQWLKIYIKTSLEYGKGFDILGLSWAKIHFVENEGMAFGIKFWGSTGKLLLSLFRLVMIGVLGYIIHNLIKAKEPLGLLISFSLIMAGAIGNILDSAFYGIIFSETPQYHGGVAELFPEGGGYANFLYGKVVDMLYFPLVDTNLPDWFPWVGGNRFQFFKPVFNIADTSISVGVISILLFHRKFFKSEKQKAKEEGISAETSSTSAVIAPVVESSNNSGEEE